jgi:hypothetical protein
MTIKMRWLDWVVRESAAPLPDMPWSRTVRSAAERRAAAPVAAAGEPDETPRAVACG